MQDHEFEFDRGLAGKVRVNDTSLGLNWRKEAALASDRWAGLPLAGGRHPLFQHPARCVHYLALEILNPVGAPPPTICFANLVSRQYRPVLPICHQIFRGESGFLSFLLLLGCAPSHFRRRWRLGRGVGLGTGQQREHEGVDLGYRQQQRNTATELRT